MPWTCPECGAEETQRSWCGDCGFGAPPRSSIWTRRQAMLLAARLDVRDPKRIDVMLGALGRLWRAQPDLRLGQLVSNLAAEIGQADPFHVEDDKMAAQLWLSLLKLGIPR